jgi:hypothetical protein
MMRLGMEVFEYLFHLPRWPLKEASLHPQALPQVTVAPLDLLSIIAIGSFANNYPDFTILSIYLQ